MVTLSLDARRIDLIVVLTVILLEICEKLCFAETGTTTSSLRARRRGSSVRRNNGTLVDIPSITEHQWRSSDEKDVSRERNEGIDNNVGFVGNENINARVLRSALPPNGWSLYCATAFLGYKRGYPGKLSHYWECENYIWFHRSCNDDSLVYDEALGMCRRRYREPNQNRIGFMYERKPEKPDWGLTELNNVLVEHVCYAGWPRIVHFDKEYNLLCIRDTMFRCKGDIYYDAMKNLIICEPRESADSSTTPSPPLTRDPVAECECGVRVDNSREKNGNVKNRYEPTYATTTTTMTTTTTTTENPTSRKPTTRSTIATTAATEPPNEPDCKNLPDGGKKKDRYNRCRYFRCQEHRAVLNRCPQGQWFDPSLLVCDDDSENEC